MRAFAVMAVLAGCGSGDGAPQRGDDPVVSLVPAVPGTGGTGATGTTGTTTDESSTSWGSTSGTGSTGTTTTPVDTGPPVDPGPITWTDVAVAAGVDYVQWAPSGYYSHACSWTYLEGGGAAAADFDSDGDIDVFAPVFLDPSRLFRNRGDGTFDEVSAALGIVTTGYANGAAWADLEGDGDLDLLVLRLGQDETNLLYVQEGGVFVESSAAWGVQTPPDVSKCSRRFSGSFADYDRDGDLDLHVAQWGNMIDILSDTSLSRLYQNQGGTYTDVTLAAQVDLTGAEPFTSGFADVDGDGALDLLVAADFETSKLFLSNGDGTFRDATTALAVGTDENGMGMAIADFDNDGLPDWFVSAIRPDNIMYCPPDWGCTGNRLFRNTGAGQPFEDATDRYGVRDGSWAWGAAAFDFDNDGDLDLTQATGPIDQAGWPYGNDGVRLFRNEGETAWPDIAPLTGIVDTGFGRTVLPADFDGDGDLDLFVTHNAGHPALWRNDGGNVAAWLDVRLAGKAPNTAGIGAKVELQADAAGPVQTRWIHANAGFAGTSPAEAWFGVGTHELPLASVKVTWPSGAVTEQRDVPPRQVLVIAEP